MDQWLSNLSAWIVQLVKSLLTAIVTLFHDGALWVFDGLLSAVVAALSAVGTVCCIDVSFSSLLNMFPPFTLYLFSMMNLELCFQVLACGVGFRLLRKAVTLGQW
jgi:hypothetical protein